jgi:hypothetical protein
VALARLRADLDAVRNALRNALTAAQAAVVREARLTVLDQLRGKLQGRLVEGGARPRPESTGRLIYPALDLGAAGDEHRQRELAYLSPLAAQPVSTLGRWERDLAGQGGEMAASGRLQTFLGRYCRRIDPHGLAAVEFLKSYRRLVEKVVRANPSGDSAQAEDRERVLRWVDNHQALAARLECGEALPQFFPGFLIVLREKLLTPWDRELRRRHLLFFSRRSAQVSLNHAERAAITDEAARTVLGRVTTAVGQGRVASQERGKDFESALAQWREWCAGRKWVAAVETLARDALSQRQEVVAASAAWEQGWSEAEGRLRAFLDQLATVLKPFEQLTPDGEEVEARLARAQRERLGLNAVQDSLAWIQTNWPAPSERVEATFALWELDGATA